MNKKYVVFPLVLIVATGFAFYLFKQPFSQSSVASPYSSPNSVRSSIEPFLPFLFPPSKQEQIIEPSQSNSSLGVVSSSTSSSSSGSIFKVVVYGGSSSGNHFQVLTPIDWSAEGPIVPGESRNSSKVNFRNEGNVPFKLYFSTSNWAFKDGAGNVPSLDYDYSQDFRLTWDYDGSEVAASETRRVTFTLNVSPNLTNVKMFSFDIVVTVAL